MRSKPITDEQSWSTACLDSRLWIEYVANPVQTNAGVGVACLRAGIVPSRRGLGSCWMLWCDDLYGLDWKQSYAWWWEYLWCAIIQVCFCAPKREEGKKKVFPARITRDISSWHSSYAYRLTEVHILRWVAAGHMIRGLRHRPSADIHSRALTKVRLTATAWCFLKSSLPTRTLSEFSTLRRTPSRPYCIHFRLEW